MYGENQLAVFWGENIASRFSSIQQYSTKPTRQSYASLSTHLLVTNIEHLCIFLLSGLGARKSASIRVITTAKNQRIKSLSRNLQQPLLHCQCQLMSSDNSTKAFHSVSLSSLTPNIKCYFHFPYPQSVPFPCPFHSFFPAYQYKTLNLLSNSQRLESNRPNILGKMWRFGMFLHRLQLVILTFFSK